MEQLKEFPVKYCKECSTVYEIDGGVKAVYYQDFPTYGLERETCCECEGK